MTFRNFRFTNLQKQVSGSLSLIVAVLLLPVFFLLHTNNELFGFIPVLHLLTFLSLTYLFTVIAGLIMYAITRSLQKTCITVFFALLFFLFWGSWLDFIKDNIGDGDTNYYRYVLPGTTIVLGLATWYFYKRPASLRRFSKYLCLLMVIFCGLELFNSWKNYRQLQKDNNLIFTRHPISDQYASCNLADTSKPDIYLFILDAYTSNRPLLEQWKYDNSDITNWLQDKGFFIPDSSKSNYSFTPYSISSVMNMDYLKIKHGKVSELPLYSLRAIKSMSDNETFRILKKEHYTFNFIGPFRNSIRKLHIERKFGDFAEKKLYSHTLTGRIFHDFGKKLKRKPTKEELPLPDKEAVWEDHITRVVVDEVKSSTNANNNRAPQFVYAHLMTTHMPHIYDSVGNLRTAEDMWNEVPEMDTYTNQVKQCNKIIKDLVQHILTHNRKNTIIIAMGDHGFRRYGPEVPLTYLFKNFCAFYFPDQRYPSTLANMSAVNTFRIVFNQYFCQNLLLLKDTSIIVKY